MKGKKVCVCFVGLIRAFSILLNFLNLPIRRHSVQLFPKSLDLRLVNGVFDVRIHGRTRKIWISPKFRAVTL